MRGIEGYRERHGIRDRDNALGREPESGAERSAWGSEQRRLRESRRSLGLEQAQERTFDHDLGLDL